MPEPLCVRAAVPPAEKPLECCVRELRAVARCLAASRVHGDSLCEETLLAFLAGDPQLDENTNYLPELFAIMRRIFLSGMFAGGEAAEAEPVFQSLSRFPIELREVAALWLGAWFTSGRIASFLQRDAAGVDRDLELLRQFVMASAGTPSENVRPIRAPLGRGYLAA